MKTIKAIVREIPQHWVGDGFPVRSLFSYHDGNKYDPFLLLDYAGPFEFPPSEKHRGVDEHPHRGFETVTIVYQGELEHRDSSGGHGVIGAGDVQWMTAASGVVHEEYHSERFTKSGGTLEMVQLWVNLPASVKMSPPKYQSILSTSIPKVSLPGGLGEVRVIAGNFEGTTGAAQTFTEIQLWDVHLLPSAVATFVMAREHTTLIVVQSGSVAINDSQVKSVELVTFENDGTDITITSNTEARLLLLSGEPIREPVEGQGPFVMNTRDEIRTAIRDYQEGRMGRL